jgi:hypothetical protein
MQRGIVIMNVKCEECGKKVQWSVVRLPSLQLRRRNEENYENFQPVFGQRNEPDTYRIPYTGV